MDKENCELMKINKQESKLKFSQKTKGLMSVNIRGRENSYRIYIQDGRFKFRKEGRKFTVASW